MRLYLPNSEPVIRLTIHKIGEEKEYLTFYECTLLECIEQVEKVLEAQGVSIFANGRQTCLDFRKCIGGQNFESRSISFRGLTPKETKSILERSFSNNSINIKSELLNLDIRDLALSVRTINALKSNNILKVSDLIKCNCKMLLGIRNFGKRSLEEIEKYLQGVKLKLAP